MLKVSPALATGMLLRLALLAATLGNHGVAGIFYEDSESFWLPFRNLHDHGVYSGDASPPFRPDPLRPPLYPLFCALTSLSHNLPLLVSLIQILLVYPLTHLALLRWLGVSRWAGLGAWFLALDVPHIVYGILLMPDTLFLLMFVVLLCRLGEGKVGWREGVLVGMMHLTRPFAHVILLGVLVWGMWEGRTAVRPYGKKAVLLLLGFVVAISPWVIRNTLTFGEPFVSLQGTHTLARTLVPVLRSGEGEHAETQAKWQVLCKVGDIHEAPLEVSRREKDLIIDEVIRQPWKTVRVALETLPVMLFNPERSSLVDMLGQEPLPSRLQFGEGSWTVRAQWLLSSPAQLALTLPQLGLTVFLWLLVLLALIRRPLYAPHHRLSLILGLCLVSTLWLSAHSITARKRLILLPLALMLALPPRDSHSPSKTTP